MDERKHSALCIRNWESEMILLRVIFKKEKENEMIDELRVP
jgi:hypothetical protein